MLDVHRRELLAHGSEARTISLDRPTTGSPRLERPVIHLTRLRHGETFYLNPDLFERVDTHVDTVIRLIDGTEYLVVEPAEEIVRRIADFRARIIALAAVLQSTAFLPADDPTGRTPARHGPPLGELALVATNPETRDESDPIIPAERPT